MEHTTIMSLASLLIALLALPASYWIAVRQVRVGLDEQDCRRRERTRLLVADALDEFFKVFYSVVKNITGIEQNDLQERLKEIDSRMTEIDAFVVETQVLERLATAINNMSAVGFESLPQSSVLMGKLQGVRNQIALGSSTKRYVTLGVISAIGGVDLQTVLREG